MLAPLRKNRLLPALSYTTETIFRLAPLLMAVITVGASEMPMSACPRSTFLALSAEPLPRSTVRSMPSCL
jgi:hypothetical protein